MTPDLSLPLSLFISKRADKDCPNFHFVEINKNWDWKRAPREDPDQTQENTPVRLAPEKLRITAQTFQFFSEWQFGRSQSLRCFDGSVSGPRLLVRI
jgi:hypothetical protein